jgi:Tfp pilus assembly protein PilO
MYLADSVTWPESVALIGILLFTMFVIGVGTATWIESRKLRTSASQEDAVRQLVNRYEQLAENSLDAQKRVAVDLAELRTRSTSIEQILRTVE